MSATIELNLDDPPPGDGGRPPARGYRRGGLVLALALVLTLGGAGQPPSQLWRSEGLVPLGAGFVVRADLLDGRLFTVATGNGRRTTSAWSMEPLRRLWSRTTGMPPGRRTAVLDNLWQLTSAGDVTLMRDARGTTVVDARTGTPRWVTPAEVLPLPGNRLAVLLEQAFRPGSEDDRRSGAVGRIWLSSGGAYTEPPLSTTLTGVELATGRRLWSHTSASPLSTDWLDLPAAILALTSADRLRVVDAGTGAVLRERPLPRIGARAAASGQVYGDTIVIRYGEFGEGGPIVAYAADTLAPMWNGEEPPDSGARSFCNDILCRPGRTGSTVLDPRTGRPMWQTAGNVDLRRHGRYALETEMVSDRPLRLRDPHTGAARVDLHPWTSLTGGQDGALLVLTRPERDGGSAFGVVLPGRDDVQPLGVSAEAVGDCDADDRFVACRVTDGVRLWSYRA